MSCDHNKKGYVSSKFTEITVGHKNPVMMSSCEAPAWHEFSLIPQIYWSS